jgi:hypothetical protein
MIQALKKLEIEEMYVNIIKAVYTNFWPTPYKTEKNLNHFL